MSPEQKKPPAPYGPISWSDDGTEENAAAPGVTQSPAVETAQPVTPPAPAVSAESAPSVTEPAPDLTTDAAQPVTPPAPVPILKDQPDQARRTAPAVAAAVVISLLIGGVAGGAAGWIAARTTTNPESGSTVSQVVRQVAGDTAATITPATDYVSAVADILLPSLVSIEWGERGREGGSGSGVIIRADGHILTNAHVVEGAKTSGDFKVVLQDGTSLSARLLGSNTSYDLAVLKVEKDDLTPANIGDSSALRVGQPVVAFGSPLGLSGTVTSGIVSALERPVTVGSGDSASFVSAIQTDAAINPGNSGGPLVDAAGTVVGINSSIATLGFGSAGNIGLGFAIPIKYAMRVAQEIIATGKSEVPVVGVVPDSAYDGPGARIGEVTANGPASGVGLAVGDVIETINDRKVNGVVELVVRIRENTPGDTVKLGVKSPGRDLRDVYVTLDGRTEE